GRVMFCGDSGHLVPIFGVRGLNSGLDDAGNLAWKLAWVIRGDAPDALLDTFSVERVHATRQNIAYGAKSTEFMAPPSYGFTLMRDAVLRLALIDERVNPLINPRQSSPISYDGSLLNAVDGLPGLGTTAAPGQPAPELKLKKGDEERHLSESFGKGFVVAAFDVRGAAAASLRELCSECQANTAVPRLGLIELNSADGWQVLHDGEQGYGNPANAVYVLRPDGYVMGRWPATDLAGLRGALQSFYP